MPNKGPHEWASKAADDRNKIAERVNTAEIKLARIVSRLPSEEKFVVMDARIHLQESLRLLEKYGASTTVCENPLAIRS